MLVNRRSPTEMGGAARTRVLILSVVCIVALGGAIVFVLARRSHQSDVREHTQPVAQTGLARVLAVPHIVFRNTNLHSGYGMLSVVSLADPSGPRAITGTECDRVYAAMADVVCLSSEPGLATTYSAQVLNDSMERVQTLPLTGIPSRTRLSHDAKYAATTSFTAGDSYAGTNFSTRTVITRVGGSSVGDLENFTLVHDGRSIKPVDRNYWGVTFASDDDTFYATVAWGGHTWLVRGSLSSRTLESIHEDAECPSLSPDGKNIVFKQRGDLPPGKWRLVDYNVATRRLTPLAETRSVDDQAEWVDNSHVLYGLPRQGSQAAVDDVWSVPISGTGKPRLLIPEAWSPAVVH
jgi:hypothetical protein